jgi:hypothetical protein
MNPGPMGGDVRQIDCTTAAEGGQGMRSGLRFLPARLALLSSGAPRQIHRSTHARLSDRRSGTIADRVSDLSARRISRLTPPGRDIGLAGGRSVCPRQAGVVARVARFLFGHEVLGVPGPGRTESAQWDRHGCPTVRDTDRSKAVPIRAHARRCNPYPLPTDRDSKAGWPLRTTQVAPREYDGIAWRRPRNMLLLRCIRPCKPCATTMVARAVLSCGASTARRPTGHGQAAGGTPGTGRGRAKRRGVRMER